jgi:hypothetical protein
MSFFLYPIKSKSYIELDSVFETFSKMGLTKYKIFQFGRWELVFYDKEYIKEHCYIEQEKNAIFLSGSFTYKGLSLNESLKVFLNDALERQIEETELYGNYFIIINIADELFYYSDNKLLINIYLEKRYSVISSSFLAILNGVMDSFRFNVHSAHEILLTGNLIRPSTLVKEITRCQIKEEINAIGLKEIAISKCDLNKIVYSFQNRSQVLEANINILDTYFKNQKNLVDEYGLVLGLTGGLDSRLLQAFSEKNFDRISYFSHYRPNDLDFKFAKILAEKKQKKLLKIKSITSSALTNYEMFDRIERAHYFLDGQIRSQIYWHEEFNTLDYEKQVYSSSKIGYHGIGGEQYRNYERMVLPFRLYNSWFKYEYIYKNARDYFYEKNDSKVFLDWISGKVEKSLPRRKVIDLTYIKIFYDEIYNKANRIERMNSLNKYILYFAPFIDPKIANVALSSAKFLGYTNNFEAHMIAQLDPELASINSNYGYNFVDGQSIFSVIPSLMKDVIPTKYKLRLYNHLRNNFNDGQYNLLKKQFDFVELFEVKSKEILLFDIVKISKLKYTGVLLIALGFMMNKYKEKLKYD